MKILKQFLSNESGATAIEYAFIAGIVSIAIAGTVSIIGAKVAAEITSVQTGL